VIREVEPPRPSTRLGTLGAGQLADAAKRRHAEPPRLISLIKGDLDWIVMKALDKDRSRRYDTAKDLAADVQRHLEHAPVQARPPELWYLAQKFFWRRKRSILAGGLCCAFFLAAVVAGLQHHRAQTLRHAARLASFRQEEAEVVPQFTAASAPATEAATMRFKACLARLADRVRQGQGSPVDCELLARVITSRVGWLGHTIQQIQEPHLRLRAGLGRWNVEGLGAVVFPTITVGNTALRAGGWEGPVDALYLDGWGSESLTTGITKPIGLRGLFSQTGRYRISGILTVQLVKARGRKEQPIRDHVKLADFEAVGPQVRLPLPPLDCTFLKEVPPHFPVELIDAAMSEKIRAGLAVQEAWIDFDAEKRARLHLELFYPYSNDAEPKFPIALAPRLLQLGGAPVLTNEPLVGYRAYGGGGATVQEFVLALPAGMNLPSENRPIAARISIQSSRQMALEEGLDELLAIPEIRKDISIELRRDGSGEAKRGAELVRQGNLAEAELLYRARLESLRPVVRADDPLLARALADLAYTMLCEGKSAEAGSLAQECLGIQEKQMPDNWRTFAARGLLGAALFGQRRYAQAEPLLLSGYEGLSQRAKWIPPDQKRTQLALPLAELVHLYTALGQTDRALEQCRKTAESTDLQLLNSLAWFLATRKNPYERDGKVAAILAGRVAAATSRKQPFVLDTLAAAYAEAGEFDKAISTQREAIGLLNDAREKSDYTSRLKLYQSNTPYREP
jgi:tetratricopeptide (TPR) repeat protein